MPQCDVERGKRTPEVCTLCENQEGCLERSCPLRPDCVVTEKHRRRAAALAWKMGHWATPGGKAEYLAFSHETAAEDYAEFERHIREETRRRIHDLETICDPAGMVQEIASLKDQVAQLTAAAGKA